MDKSREDFEVYAKSVGLDFSLSNWLLSHPPKHGYYLNKKTQDAWVIWQASRRALVVTVPDKVMEEDEFDKGHNCAIDYCAEAIREAGITVKGEGDE